MKADTFFFDSKDGKTYIRRGGNKIEPLSGFFLLQEVAGTKKPLLVATAILTVTVDASYVLFQLPTAMRQVLTVRKLHKDGSFLAPKAPEGFTYRPAVAPPSSKKRVRKKKRPAP